MEEIRVKNFRCVEQESGEYRVYFSLHGEERWIGYYKGYLSGNEDKDEQNLTGSNICDYADVIKKWKMSDTRTVYQINIYEAYRMDEQGVRFMFHVPEDTTYYKHEVMGEKDYRFPAWTDGVLVTEGNNSFSFVSVNGIKDYKFDE